jgi:hypothetical protein
MVTKHGGSRHSLRRRGAAARVPNGRTSPPHSGPAAYRGRPLRRPGSGVDASSLVKSRRTITRQKAGSVTRAGVRCWCFALAMRRALQAPRARFSPCMRPLHRAASLLETKSTAPRASPRPDHLNRANMLSRERETALSEILVPGCTPEPHTGASTDCECQSSNTGRKPESARRPSARPRPPVRNWPRKAVEPLR